MISEVWFNTNRTVCVFDEDGEQLPKEQALLSKRCDYLSDEWKYEEILKQIIKDKPTIQIVKFQTWAHVINMDEFCCLIGFDKWYYEFKQSEEYLILSGKQINKED